MRSIVSAISLALLLSCGPMGNTGGFEGVYSGDVQVVMTGKLTLYNGSQSTVVDVDDRQTIKNEYMIEPGYDTDAVVVGLACALNLRLDGDKLTLKSSTTCAESEDYTGTSGANSSHIVDSSSTDYTKVEIEKNGDRGIKMTVAATRATTKEEDGTKTQEGDADIGMTFSGTRITNY